MHSMTCGLILVCWSYSYSEFVDIARRVDEFTRNNSLSFAARPLTVAKSAVPYLPRIALSESRGPDDGLPFV